METRQSAHPMFHAGLPALSADREAHEKMGFPAGWGIATDRLEALAQKL